ncbi:hypothetical protein FJZ48_03075 [Candidatus Uhrbacteria bacterium]|nr:hypothetical protein [Candidatus Uhrbacteria bacterium]
MEKTPLAELMYDVKDSKLHISLVPKQGEWSPSDVTFTPGEPRFDLIIALGAPDRNALGPIAQSHADFLYRTPIINIDYHASNEYWGQLNMVDLTAVSTTEVLYHWLTNWNQQFIDDQLSTALLCGMIANTKSFRTNTVTPKTLKSAADLVARGAKRDQIVQGLWRTRPISTLKLWGRVLSRVEQDEELGILWSRLSQTDFIETGTSQDALEGVIDELLTYAPQAKTVILFFQTSADRLTVYVQTLPPRSALELTRPFSGEGTAEYTQFSFAASDLVQGTRQIIDRIKQLIRTLGV